MKRIGKIKSIDLCNGSGYQNTAFGLDIKFNGKDENGDDWEGYYFDGHWAVWIKWRKDNKWTEQDRTDHFGNILRRINELVVDAKVNSFLNLKNVPVEVILSGCKVESFRILKEVL